ncbi:MAG: transcriptional regulator, BadM/Rrf2 family [Actinomycetia bacterium]|nr:transcriptional regulator, BadM/Rrf2 family [Actinomycetes bacterium]
MRISAKADYAVRALAELAATESGHPVKGEVLATRQGIPLNFLENILRELRHAGIVRTQRGADGGYLLARPAAQINLAEILRAVEGPLAAVQGTRPDELVYDGAAASLVEVWVAVRANLRAVLERVTLADLAKGTLPAAVRKIAAKPDSWLPH